MRFTVSTTLWGDIAACPWGVAAAVGGAVVSGALSNSAASTEAGATSAATGLAVKQQQNQQTATDNAVAPAVAAGNNALTSITDLSGANGPVVANVAQSEFTADPGYQFMLDQGTKAVENSAAARGLGTSGAEIKGASGYAEGLAQQGYSNYYNRLSSLAGLGQQAIQTSAGLGAQAASGEAQTTASGATQQNQITTNGTNALTGTVNNLANNGAVLNALSSYGSTTTPDQFTALGGTGGF